MRIGMNLKLRNMVVALITATVLCLTGCRDEHKPVINPKENTEAEAAKEEKNIKDLKQEEESLEEQNSVNESENVNQENIKGYDTEKLDEYIAEVEEKAAEIKESLENDELNQADMNMKSQELYELWDEALNYLWKELKNNLPEDQFKGLKEEQLIWISEKETAVKEAGQEFVGGSIHALIVNSEAARITEERVYILLSLLKNGL